MESIFKLGILLSVIDRVSGPSARIGTGMVGLRGKVMSLGPAFDKFKTYGLLVTTLAAGLLSMMSGTVMATVPTQKALGELSSVGIVNLQALEQAGAEFSNKWSGTTKAEFISAAYDIKSGISSLSDEGVAEFSKLAALTGKATKSTTAEMTSLFATGYSIYKEAYAGLSDMEFGEVFSAGISASVKNFKTTGSGMAQAISQLGAAATTAKVPLAEQLSILGMLQATMSGSEAGTKYKAMMQSAAGAGEKLNLQFLDANNQLLGMPDILLTLQKKYGSTLDEMEKMEIQKAFGTQEAVAVIDLMYSKVGDLQTNITSLGMAMDQGSSFADQMAMAMNMDIGAGADILGQQWDNLVQVIGKKLIPILIPLFSWIGNIIVAIQDFARENETIVQVAVLVVAGVAAVAFVLGVLATVFGSVGLLYPNVVTGFGMISKSALFMKTSLLSAVASTKTWILWQRQALLTSLYFHGGVIGLGKAIAVSFLASIKIAIAAVWSFTAALLANPITWVVIGVVALGGALYLLYQKFEFVRNIVDGVMYVFGLWLGHMIKTGRGIIMALTHPLEFIKWGFAMAGESVGMLTAGLDGVLSWIKGKVPEFMASGKALWGAFTGGIQSMVMAPVETVKAGLSKLRNLLPFSDAKEGPLSTLTLSGARMMETLGTGIQSAAPGLVKTASAALAGVAVASAVGTGIKVPPAKIKNQSVINKSISAAAQQKADNTVAKKEIHIHINGLELPGVSDSHSLIAELLKLAGGHDV